MRQESNRLSISKEDFKRYMEESKSESYIRLPDCKKGYLYRLHSRNLSYGVYDGNEGFIGIRLKFHDRYLFTEYHWDQGPPYGTVKPMEEVCPLPEGVIPQEDLGSVNSKTGRKVQWDYDKKAWVYFDTQEMMNEGFACIVDNTPLFNFIDKYEKDIYGLPVAID